MKKDIKTYGMWLKQCSGKTKAIYAYNRNKYKINNLSFHL